MRSHFSATSPLFGVDVYAMLLRVARGRQGRSRKQRLKSKDQRENVCLV